MARLDHYVLNDVEGLENPTAENIASWVAARVNVKQLVSVRVYETPMCWVEFDCR